MSSPMHPRRRLALLAIIGALAAIAPTLAQPRDAAALTGITRAADTASPLRRVLLRLSSLDRRETRAVMSDGRGRFEFKDVVPGRYVLAAVKGGYVPAQYGQKRAFGQGTAIDVKAGDALDLTIDLAAGASIDGVVLDEFGEPVADAMVMTQRNQYAGGRRRLTQVGRVLTTNDRGEYRLFGLPPGTYILSASPLPNQGAAEAGTRAGYAPSYYPGTPDVGLADAITLEAGEHRNGINVALMPVRTASVSGTVFDSESKPMSGGVVSATNRASGLPLLAASGALKPDGTFALDGLAPGRYLLQAAANAAPVAGVPLEVASAEIEMVSADLAGLRLSVPRLSRVSGTVLIDGKPVNPAGMQVRVRPNGGSDAGDSTSTTITPAANGAFGGDARPGRVLFDVIGAAPRWFLQSVTANGNDLIDNGVELDEGEELSGLVVSLTSNPSRVAGSPRDEKSPIEYVAIVFAKDPAAWQFRSRRIAATRAQRDGSFEIKGLPSGSYLAIGVDYIEAGEERDPELLEQWSAKATEVTVAEGQTSSVKVRVIRR